MKYWFELITRNTTPKRTREQIQKDTEVFLKNGGTIKIIPAGVTSNGRKEK